MDRSDTSYNYKAGVRDKVKEIESKLRRGSTTLSRNNLEDVPNPDGDGERGSKTDGKKSIEINLEQNAERNLKSVTQTQSAVKTTKPILIPPQPVLTLVQGRSSVNKNNSDKMVNKMDHLNKQVTRAPEEKNEASVSTVPVQIPSPPKPTPRKFPVPARQSFPIESAEATESENDSNFRPPSSSASTRRSSSEDDGIADMASESDAFDDSSMPLPKIKDNAFYLKDRQKSSDGEAEHVRSIYGLPPNSPRRASFNPQSGLGLEGDFPRGLRRRSDSTNSAENFVVRQISHDDDDGRRRDSQAEFKVDVLQSKAFTQIHSPVRSPVVVRSRAMNYSAASILVLGLPQSGKSATIASLVQKSSVLETSSETSEVVEYTAKIKILDSSNLFNLKIIETPGYTNDPGFTSDARFMSTLVSYLESKDGLGGKPPTMVLVTIRFDDKRIWNPEDEHPDIVNFLKLINNFQKYFNGGKYANFVFVLTHFLSGTASDQERKKPQTKILELINLIQKYTSLPLPVMVVCAENDQSIWKHDSTNGGGSLGVTLPNGETFPFNLIEKIKILLTKKGRDSVGETVLRTAFGIEYPYSIKECNVTHKIPLVPPTHSSVQPMQKAILHAYLDIERTEIFTLLEIGWENIEPKVREKFPDSLFTVQQIFQTKKVCNFTDIPEDPSKVLTLVRQMPSNLAVKDLLIDTLQLKVPACYPTLYIGQGYDLSKDTTTNVSPFLLNSGLKTSPVGQIPNEFECKIRDDREICFKFFHTVEEYVSERLKDLNLRYSISSDSLSALSASTSKNHRLGYNLLKANQEISKFTVATAVIEYRVFQVTIQPITEASFKPQFWDTLKDLPDLDIKDSVSVSAWKDFFGYWGTHVVKSAFGGGSVEITFRGNVLSKIINSLKKDFIIPSDEYETSKVFQWITGDGLDFVAACGKDVKSDFLQGYDIEAHFHGGDLRFQQVDLTKLPSKEEVANVREEWKESLVLNPVMLETNLVLVPLSYFVRNISEGLATKIDVALHYFYSDFMVSQGKQSSCTIL